MRETVELRIPEDRASEIFRDDLGRRLGDVRVIELAPRDSRLERVAEINQEYRRRGSYFYASAFLKRSYSRSELMAAELLRLDITTVFEPAGEECGTRYEESEAGPFCGAGRVQVSDLILDVSRIPPGRDIASTIADEWVVSQRLASLLLREGVIGFELRPVQHSQQAETGPIDPRALPSGRAALDQAAAAGAPHPGWQFWVWLNQPEQQEIVKRMYEEHNRQRRGSRRPPKGIWHQLLVTSPPVSVVPPTRFGIDPLDDDKEGRFRCPFGHVAGLNLLSEVRLDRATWDGSDVSVTQELLGIRSGLLTPAPIILVSPRLWRVLLNEGMKGFRAEVAHLS